MPTYYVDFENGDDARDGMSWANAWKTLTSGATAARISAGDIIRMAKSPAPISVGDAKWTSGKWISTAKTPETVVIHRRFTCGRESFRTRQ